MCLIKKLLNPDVYINQISDLDVDDIKGKGIKILLVDLDNTLSKHGSQKPDEYALEQIRRIKNSGLECILFSNALSRRASEYANIIGIDYIASPAKPTKKGINKFLEKYSTYKKSEVAIVGDQLFTDILAGKRSKIYTILVNPLYEAETGQVKFKRGMERFIKRYLKLSIS